MRSGLDGTRERVREGLRPTEARLRKAGEQGAGEPGYTVDANVVFYVLREAGACYICSSLLRFSDSKWVPCHLELFISLHVYGWFSGALSQLMKRSKKDEKADCSQG